MSLNFKIVIMLIVDKTKLQALVTLFNEVNFVLKLLSLLHSLYLTKLFFFSAIKDCTLAVHKRCRYFFSGPSHDSNQTMYAGRQSAPQHNHRGWVYAWAYAHVVCGFVTCGAFMLLHQFLQEHVELKCETSDSDSTQHVSVSSFRPRRSLCTLRFCLRLKFCFIFIHITAFQRLSFHAGQMF